MSCAEGLSLIEHFLPWIPKHMLVYQDQESNDNDLFDPKPRKFSKVYYMKNVN